MSIASVDRSAQERDDVQQTRNEYSEREASTARRQRKEVQTLTNQYEKDLEKLATDYDHRATNQSKHTNEILSDKDRKYQSEINELKKMHVQKLRDMTEKNQDETAALRDAKDSDLKATQARHARQENELQHKYEGELSDSEKNLNRQTTEMREKLHEDLGGQRKELNAAHQAEVDRLRTNRDETVGDLREGLQHTRDDERRNIARERGEHIRDNAIHDKRLLDVVGEERRANNQVLDEHRMGTHRALQQEAEKYANALKQRDEANNEYTGDFRQTVMRRQDEQVGRLETELVKERATNRSHEEGVRKISNIERDHVTQQYQNRFDELEKRNHGQVLASNDLRKRDMDQVHKSADQLLASAGKQNREQIEQVRTNEVEPYRNEVSQLEAREQRQIRESGMRDDKLNGIRNRDLKTVSDYYDAKIGANKMNTEEMLHEQQLKFISERNEMMRRYEQKAQSQQEALTQKHETAVARYEDALADTKAKYESELRRQQELHDMKFREQDHRAATDLEREHSANQVQLNAMRDHYEKELDFMRKRNEQEKIELAKRKV